MKRCPSFRCFWLVVLWLAGLPALAHEPGAHVHGTASLQVAIDGANLTLNLESPLDNLLGFEHAPRTEKQKAAVRGMVERLNQAATLFAPTPAARCAPVSVQLDSPVLEPAKKTEGDSHADLDGEFTFRCASPEALHDIEVRLFDSFPNLRQLDVQVASPRGQTAPRLSPKQRRISW